VLRSSPPRERADAARNRAAVLEAAATLFRAHGVAAVSMDAVAAAAGVGKGTLFRRFGDKAGLAVALLDARERELQEAILTGPAPLGPGAGGIRPEERSDEIGRRRRPGAPSERSERGRHSLGEPGDEPAPGERLVAFVDAYLTYALDHLDLLRMSETGSAGARYRIGAYRFWHRHVALLLAHRADPDADAHSLLAPLAAEHLRAVVAELGADRVRGTMCGLARALAGAGHAREEPTPAPAGGRSGGDAAARADDARRGDEPARGRGRRRGHDRE
jgi:AcrR family transcriptional regulator